MFGSFLALITRFFSIFLEIERELRTGVTGPTELILNSSSRIVRSAFPNFRLTHPSCFNFLRFSCSLPYPEFPSPSRFVIFAAYENMIFVTICDTMKRPAHVQIGGFKEAHRWLSRLSQWPAVQVGVTDESL